MSEMEEFDGDDVMVAMQRIAKDVALTRGEIVEAIRLSGGSKVPSSAAERKDLLAAAYKAISSSADMTEFAAGREVDPVDIDIAIRLVANDPSLIRKAVAEPKKIEKDSR